MSDEGGEMSSEAAFKVAPMVGNAHFGQRGSGHSVVSLPNTYPGIDLESVRFGGEARVRANDASEGCMCTSA